MAGDDMKVVADMLMSKGEDNLHPFCGVLLPSIGALRGETILKIEVSPDRDMIRFVCESGLIFRMYHLQDCCEEVLLEEVIGDLDDLLGTPIVMAEEVVSEGGEPIPCSAGSWTWTFYKFATAKGYVTLRWLGESNGYYSERVTFACTGLDDCSDRS